MSEAVTLLTVPEALAAAERIFKRADAALTLRRALDGVPDRELVSIVVLARQLHEIAQQAAVFVLAAGEVSDPPTAEPSTELKAWLELRTLLFASGHLVVTPRTEPKKEPAHGEG